MKEIIGDKFYDTSTSKEIHHDENIKSMHNNFSETLYMSKKGELFIIGWDCRNNTIDSNKVVRVDEAIEWCKNHKMGKEEIIKIFCIKEG